MTLSVQSRDFEITANLFSHTQQETRHLTERFPHLSQILVRLKRQGSSHVADVVVQGKKTRLQVEASSTNMYQAIHQARIKAERRLNRLYDAQFRFGNHA